MTSPTNAFSNHLVARLSGVREGITRLSLRIAVLGPNLEDINKIGTQKRYQIRDALQDNGHGPFFPEDEIDMSDSSQVWIELERQLLSDVGVDLVIMLHTEDSYGVLSEISNFVSVSEIHAKSAILFPAKFYEPDRKLPANTVQAYLDKMLYTDEEMAACHVVDQCIEWASERQNESWPGLISQDF